VSCLSEFHAAILCDLDPTQYLWDGRRITAIIDTEGYAIGPREWDFVVLEYLMEERAAKAFRVGYETIMAIPDLSEVRTVYRYFGRLISVQGSKPINKWMNHHHKKVRTIKVRTP
jgi:aminoglycoside phosphotransferase (APT) family kinase protein